MVYEWRGAAHDASRLCDWARLGAGSVDDQDCAAALQSA